MMENNADEDVKLFAPDYGLQAKIGLANLDLIFSPQAVAAAQAKIADHAENFLQDSENELQHIAAVYAKLRQPGENAPLLLADIVAAAFCARARFFDQEFTGLSGCQ